MVHSFVLLSGTFSGVQLAIPAIMQDFDIPVTTAVWVLLAYSVGLSGASMTFAGLSTYFDRRALVLLGMTVDVLVMIVIFFTHSIYVFILCRYLQATFRQFPWLIFQLEGIGGFPAEHRGKALGYSTMSSGLGMMLSLPLTGVVTDSFGWRWLFLGTAVIFAAMIPLVFALLPKLSPDPSRKRPLSTFDFRGGILMMLGVITLITAAQLYVRGIDLGILIPMLAMVGVISLAGFIAAELRTKTPVLQLSVFRVPGVFLAASQSLVMGFVNGAFILFLPFLFIRGFGWTTAFASGILFFQGLTRPVAGHAAGRLADRFGSAAVIFPAAVVGIAAQLLLATLGASPSARLVAAALIGWGTAQTLMQTANLRQIYGALPADQLHLAPSLNLVISTLGGTAGQAFASIVVDSATRKSTGGADFSSYLGDALLIMTLVFAIGMVCTQLIPRLWLRPQGEPVHNLRS